MCYLDLETGGSQMLVQLEILLKIEYMHQRQVVSEHQIFGDNVRNESRSHIAATLFQPTSLCMGG